MAKGIRIDFFVYLTGINKNTLYTFSKPSADKSISIEKLDKINNAIDRIERIMNND
jgi:hypothetical protein